MTAAPSRPVSIEPARCLVWTKFDVAVTYAPHWDFPEHEHPHTCVSLVMKGSFRDLYRGLSREATPGTVASYSKRSSHSGLIALTGAEVFQLEIEVDDFSSQQENPTCAAELAPGLARELLFEFLTAPLEDELVLSSLAHELAAAVHGLPERPLVRAPSWLGRVLELFRENVSRPLTLDQLASEAGLHRCHFAREFQRHRGMSAGDYRRRLRVALAAKKLSLTCLALAEIAHELGFADHSHMGRQFKRFIGMTPAQYRATVA